MKTCPGCGKNLSRNMFYNNVSKFDGLSSRCKVCIKKDGLEAESKKIGKRLAEIREMLDEKITLIRDIEIEDLKLQLENNIRRKLELESEFTASWVALIKEMTNPMDKMAAEG